MFVARDICLAAALFPILLFLSFSAVGSWLLPMIWVLAVFMLPLRLVIGMALLPIALDPTVSNVVIAPLAVIGYLAASRLRKKRFFACFVANMFPYMGAFMLYAAPVAVAGTLTIEGISMIEAVIIGIIVTLPLALVVTVAISLPVAALQVKVLNTIQTRLGVGIK